MSEHQYTGYSEWDLQGTRRERIGEDCKRAYESSGEEQYQKAAARIDELQAENDRLKSRGMRSHTPIHSNPTALDSAMIVRSDYSVERISAAGDLAKLQAECKNWEETAAQYARNQEYYQGLVVQCGEVIGDSAYICDDGSRAEDVLCAKVPELVQALQAERDALKEFAAMLYKQLHNGMILPETLIQLKVMAEIPPTTDIEEKDDEQ